MLTSFNNSSFINPTKLFILIISTPVLLKGGPPHCHQPKPLRYPHTEIFTFLQLFMRIQLIFSFWGTINFLS
ncbi:hypothetical protein DM800_26160 [Bacillus sp. AY18-3]|nr:hypothetical protein DM800_26160 [Bacillus sp. AY18-3]